MSPSIIVSIDLNGETEIEVVGAKGKQCTDITQALEATLGQVTDRKFKAEYRENNATINSQLKQRS